MPEKPNCFAAVVLLVEDHSAVRETLADVIHEPGRTVFTDSDGAEALRMLASKTVRLPCLVLLDWLKPGGVSGGEFLGELAARALKDNVGVIVMSASPSVGVSQMPPGVLGYLQKPFDVDELVALLDRFC